MRKAQLRSGKLLTLEGSQEEEPAQTPTLILHPRLGCPNKSPSSPTEDVTAPMELTEQ